MQEGNFSLLGKLEPSPATASAQLIPTDVSTAARRDYHDGPRRWKIWEIQDNLSLYNYDVRNLPHIPHILRELIKISSGFFF